MRNNFGSFLNEFKKDQRGNFAMMLGLSSMVLLTCVGAAIDYTGMAKVKQNLQNQVDSGVLAAARLEGTNGNAAKMKDRRAAAHQIMEANGFNLTFNTPTVNNKNGVITVRAQAEYKTVFMGILGKSSMPVNAIAKSEISNAEKLEIVLVLDNTLSMTHDGKLDALKTGAKGLVSAMSGNPNVKIGIVPFARYVNIGEVHKTETWLSHEVEQTWDHTYDSTTYTGGTAASGCTDVPYSYVQDGFTVNTTRQDCATPGTSGTPTTTPVTITLDSKWEGCVGTRNSPYNITDDNINIKIPGINNITRDTSPGATTGSYWYNYCPRALTRLTNDFTKLGTEIDGLWGTDNTYMPLGLIWGQRVLSPKAPFDDGDTNVRTKRVLILFTDGKNTVEMNWPPHLQDSADKITAPGADADTAKLCENIKREGTVVYSIAFQVNDNMTRKMLKRCANGNSNYFKADNNAALVKAFDKIASGLSNVRLTQ